MWRSAVRSIAWLGLFVRMGRRRVMGVPKLSTAEKTHEKPKPDSARDHKEGLHLKVPDVVETVRLKQQQCMTSRRNYRGDAAADSNLPKPARTRGTQEWQHHEPDAAESDCSKREGDADDFRCAHKT
jgi:hypothetical protein